MVFLIFMSISFHSRVYSQPKIKRVSATPFSISRDRKRANKTIAGSNRTGMLTEISGPLSFMVPSENSRQARKSSSFSGVARSAKRCTRPANSATSALTLARTACRPTLFKRTAKGVGTMIDVICFAPYSIDCIYRLHYQMRIVNTVFLVYTVNMEKKDHKVLNIKLSTELWGRIDKFRFRRMF